MMDYQLTLPTLLERARRRFPEQQIVSNMPEGTHRYTFRDFYRRVCRLMNVLRDMGVQPGERVATYAWNHYRHMELYYAVPALGAVLHTLNIRLAPQQLEYIVNNAEDTTIFADADLAPQLVPLLGRVPSVRRFVIMGAEDPAATGLVPALDYETLMAGVAEDARFPSLRERDACLLCYTSGTTGDPKGVLYSHRSQVLQCLIGGMTDNFQFTEGDVMLAIAPMFHVNGWGIPFLCAMLGARPVLPGPSLDSATLVRLIREERVTFTNGVPTIWSGVLDHLREHGGDLDRLERVLIGGAPVPLSLVDAFQREYGVALRQAWGMTETAPPGRPLVYTRSIQALPDDEKLAFLRNSATVGPCEEIKVVDEQGHELPWDDTAMGELLVRGVGVAAGYFNNPEASQAFADGWLHTGDVVSVDPRGNYRIRDRAKDLIKSGGEWISSAALENAIMSCASVAEAAVVARPDHRWDERPVAFVVLRSDVAAPSPADIIAHIAPEFAKWQLPGPEDIRFVDALPKTSVGKFDKKVLRTLV